MNTHSFEHVLQDYEPLIKSQIKKLHLTRHYDEYYQVGVIALWYAYQKFEQGKGSFSAYAFHTVRGHMLMALREEISFSDRHVLQDEQTSFHFDEPDPTARQDITLDELAPYTKTLSNREKLWFQEAIISGKKLGEIATEQNVSRHTVSSWRKQALKKLRKVMTRSEDFYTPII